MFWTTYHILNRIYIHQYQTCRPLDPLKYLTERFILFCTRGNSAHGISPFPTRETPENACRQKIRSTRYTFHPAKRIIHSSPILASSPIPQSASVTLCNRSSSPATLLAPVPRLLKLPLPILPSPDALPKLEFLLVADFTLAVSLMPPLGF